MKIILLLIPVIYSITLCAQSTDDLDEKYGYKDIRFEMKVDSLKKEVKLKTGLIKLETDDYLYWYIADKKYRSFGDFSVAVSIGELKGEGTVGSILLTFLEVTKFDFKKVVQFFESLYGKPTEYSDILEKAQWVGKDVVLYVERDYIRPSLHALITSAKSIKIAEENKKKRMEKSGKEF